MHSESDQQPPHLNCPRTRQTRSGFNSLQSRIWLATVVQQGLRIGANSLVSGVGLADS